jgi:hypothetical protein
MEAPLAQQDVIEKARLERHLEDPVLGFQRNVFLRKTNSPPIEFAAVRPEIPHTRLLEMPAGYVDST